VRTPRRAVVGLVAAALLAGCAPPPDRDDAGSSRRPRDGGPPAAPQSPPATPPAAGSPVAAGMSAETTPPQTTDAQVPVVYEKLRGGVHVARCPSCGEVQSKSAAKCPGCGQKLSAWRHEAICTRCEGDGRCDRCGDDRVCLACDGDGACPACSGTGKAAGGAAKCPECGGGGRCAVCHGDGRREQSGGDFAASEGWLPGACPTCIDGSGLCPECGSAGKDVSGAPCPTCGGAGVCPDCGGSGECAGCAGDGACTVCSGGGREVVNGRPRGPDERVRTLRTAAGALVVGCVDTGPSLESLRLVRTEGGKTASTMLARAELAPLSWWLVQRDFAPGWDGRAAPEPADHSKFLSELADLAAENGWWPLALRSLSASMTLDPARAAATRVRFEEIEAKRVDDWMRRADAAAKAGDRDTASALLSMAQFRGRGTATAARAELQLLRLRKDREREAEKLGEAEKERLGAERAADARQAAERARTRLDRARRLLEKASRAAGDDATADRTFARAEWAATSARRIVQSAAFRDPPGGTAWPAPPASIVTESRLVSTSILESWASRAVAGGRFDLAARTARRALALDPAAESLRRILTEAEAGLARSGVLLGSPPPSPR
jgi:tetratricopeptide (TPR) repeat protein